MKYPPKLATGEFPGKSEENVKLISEAAEAQKSGLVGWGGKFNIAHVPCLVLHRETFYQLSTALLSERKYLVNNMVSLIHPITVLFSDCRVWITKRE